MPSFDVIAIGSATQDLFVKSKKFEEIRDPSAPDGYETCFPLGAKIGVDDIIFATGGGATNAAVTFARFGLKTACATRVGKDQAGDGVIRQLKKEKIETRFIQRDAKWQTAHSIILLSGTGHRTILTYRGASAFLSRQRLPDARWYYVTSLAGNLALLRDVFAQAKRQHARIAWNPGNLELEHGFKQLATFLKQTDVLDLNREEASLLTGLPKRHLDRIVAKLGPLVRTALVITDGQRGATVHAEGITWHAPALKAKRVNTTGAGDAFGSAFVAALARGRDLKAALHIGLLNAKSVIMHMGAKAGILKKMPL